jgi:hypothetical protein
LKQENTAYILKPPNLFTEELKEKRIKHLWALKKARKIIIDLLVGAAQRTQSLTL